MNREEKQTEVSALKERFVKAQLAVLTDYRGLSSNDFNSLRKKLREKGSTIKVIKNRLAKIALKGTEWESMTQEFKGTTAIAVTDSDPTAPAKVLVDFLKGRETFSIRGGSIKGRTISVKEIEALASMPSREELLGMLLGSMQAPARNWVSVLAQIPRRFVQVLAAVRDQKEKS